MTMRFVGDGRSVSRLELEAWQGSHGVRLPEGLMDLYLKLGDGGVLVDEGDDGSLDAFYRISDAESTMWMQFLSFGRREDLVPNIDSTLATISHALPPSSIPFVIDAFGNFFLLLANASVAFFNHDTGDTTVVAQTFDDFFSRITFVD